MPGMLIIPRTRRILWARRNRTSGVFSTCTAMFGSGAKTGTVIIRIKTCLTRKDQKKATFAWCVAVRGSTILDAVARPFVTGSSLATVAATAVSVSASTRTDYFGPKMSPLVSWGQAVLRNEIRWVGTCITRFEAYNQGRKWSDD
jgi:hypothetical protein